MPNRKYYEGMTKLNNQNLKMTIIKYNNHKSIIVEFEDGVQIECTPDSYKAGSVQNPNFPKPFNNSLKQKRIGLIKVNNLGEKMQIIEYKSYSDITVLFLDEYKGQVKTTWMQWEKGIIKNPNYKLTEIVKHPPNFIDITGKIYNNLKVIKWDINPPKNIIKTDSTEGRWLCQCLICGEYTWGRTNQIINGKKKYCKKCGEKAKIPKRRRNTYDLSGDYGIGFTIKNEKFYFDLEDYDKIKEYTWSFDQNGYVRTSKNGNNNILMHRIILNVTDSNIVVDHISHNNADNRKINLRVTSDHNNTMNEKLAINNKSGITGVRWDTRVNKWESYIWFNGKTIHLGRYDKKEDAIKARLAGEEKYFKEYGYNNSMKKVEEYGISEIY